MTTSSTDLQPMFRDILHSMNLQSSPVLLQELQELHRICAAEHLADTLWMRLHRPKAFDLLGHLRGRPNRQLPGTETAAQTETELTDSMPHHEGKAKAITSVLPSTRSSLGQSYSILGFYVVLSTVVNFLSNLTVKED